jgi:hypothetical protein
VGIAPNYEFASETQFRLNDQKYCYEDTAEQYQLFVNYQQSSVKFVLNIRSRKCNLLLGFPDHRKTEKHDFISITVKGEKFLEFMDAVLEKDEEVKKQVP